MCFYSYGQAALIEHAKTKQAFRKLVSQYRLKIMNLIEFNKESKSTYQLPVRYGTVRIMVRYQPGTIWIFWVTPCIPPTRAIFTKASSVPLKYLGRLYHLQLQISSAVWRAVRRGGSPFTRGQRWSISPLLYMKHFLPNTMLCACSLQI